MQSRVAGERTVVERSITQLAAGYSGQYPCDLDSFSSNCRFRFGPP